MNPLDVPGVRESRRPDEDGDLEVYIAGRWLTPTELRRTGGSQNPEYRTDGTSEGAAEPESAAVRWTIPAR